MLALEVAKREGIIPGKNISQLSMIQLLVEHGIIPPLIAELFHLIRRIGKSAVHSIDSNSEPAEALTCLRAAWQIGFWFNAAYGEDESSQPEGFLPRTIVKQPERNCEVIFWTNRSVTVVSAYR